MDVRSSQVVADAAVVACCCVFLPLCSAAAIAGAVSGDGNARKSRFCVLPYNCTPLIADDNDPHAHKSSLGRERRSTYFLLVVCDDRKMHVAHTGTYCCGPWLLPSLLFGRSSEQASRRNKGRLFCFNNSHHSAAIAFIFRGLWQQCDISVSSWPGTNMLMEQRNLFQKNRRFR